MACLKTLTLAASIAALMITPPAISGVYKCVDAGGKITFSGQGCSKKQSTEVVKVGHVNTEDNSRLRESMVENYLKSLEEDHQPQAILLNDDSGQNRHGSRSAAGMSSLCKEALTPYPGAQNRQLTARQMAMAAGCAGGKNESAVQAISDEYKARSQAEADARAAQPSVITNCDQGGCGDNLGQRYNGAAGTTFIRQDGKVCQNLGGIMQCH